VGTFERPGEVIPPFSQLSDFAYYGTSGNSDTLLYYYNDSALTGTCWVVRALAPWGHVLDRGDEASHGRWVGWSVEFQLSASGDGRLVLPWPTTWAC
jgi:hypothetical protein